MVSLLVYGKISSRVAQVRWYWDQGPKGRRRTRRSCVAYACFFKLMALSLSKHFEEDEG